MIPTFDSISIQSSEMTLALALWIGVLSSLNICAVVRLPVMAAYVAGIGTTRKHAVLLAVLLTVGLGVGTWLLGQAAVPVEDGVHKTLQVNKYAFWALGGCLVATGLLISGLINPQLVPEQWRRIGHQLAQANVPGALLLGLVLGLLQTPACPTCRAELLTVVEGVPKGSSATGLTLLIAFAAGQSLVALGAGVMTAVLKPDLLQWLRKRMCSLEPRLQLLTGNLLVVLGVYFVIVG